MKRTNLSVSPLCSRRLFSISALTFILHFHNGSNSYLFAVCKIHTRAHADTKKKKNTLSLLRPLQDVYVPVCKCECACGDTEDEALWVHRGIKWQTSDTHMLSHLTCSRVPAVSGQKRANEKEREAEWHRHRHRQTHTNKCIYKCLYPLCWPQGNHRETIKRGCTATLYN